MLVLVHNDDRNWKMDIDVYVERFSFYDYLL